MSSALEKIGRYRIKVLAVVWLLYVINYFDKMAVLNLLPLIRQELNVDYGTIGFAASLFFFAYALAQLPAGVLADKFGPKKVMYFAITVFSFFTFFTGIIQNVTAFILVRLGLGFGEGFHFVPSIRTISDWFPPKEKGRATSFFTTSWTVAPAIGAIMITSIAAAWGWRAVFFTLAVPGFLGIFALWYWMRNTPEEAHAEGRVSKAELEYIKEGLATQAQAGSPKAPFSVVAKDPHLWVITSIVFIKTFVYWGAATWLSSFLVEQHGFSITTMGLLASLPFFVGFVSQMSSGWIMDKITGGKAKPIFITAFTLLAAVLYFVTTIPKGDVTLLIMALAVQGWAVVFYDGPIYAFVQMRYPKEMIGTVTGITQMIGQFGSFVAPTIAGFLVIAKTATSAANYTNVFLLFMVAALVGIALSLVISESPLKKTTESPALAEA
ncbi:MAG: MFS transporter [Bacteroidetes bacterium]|nr:MFS transporter [Bacteroidota bacterium]